MRFRRILRVFVLCLAVLIAIDACILVAKWPFERDRATKSLEHFASSKLQIAQFHLTFFPHPGYIAENLRFLRRSTGGDVQLALVRRIQCEGTWWAMISFTHHIKEFRIEGLQVSLPSPVPKPMKMHPELHEETSMTKIVANGTTLDVMSNPGDTTPLHLAFRQLIFTEVAKGKPTGFQIGVHIPEPNGDLSAAGSFGPIEAGRLPQMPVGASFRLRNADLSGFKAIAGVLSADGTISGKFGSIQVRGKATVPDFETTSTHHKLPMTTEFAADVDGQHGNVRLRSVTARFLRTTVTANGTVSGEPGQSKTGRFELESSRGRLEDLLRLFVSEDRPPATGDIALHAGVVVPPGKQEFLRRMRLDGSFELQDSQFTQPATQHKLDQLSERAHTKTERKEQTPGRTMDDPPDVGARVKADVVVRNANASLSHVTFDVPAASAQGEGTFNLLSHVMDFRGKLAMHATLSQAAGGFKSILLLPLNPFFKKDHAGAVVPFEMKGTYGHPVFRLSLRGKKQA
jgi:AsmA-like C-terminal region